MIDREDAREVAQRLTLASAVASLRPPNEQQYALVAVVWPDGPQPAKEFGINVLGAFRTLEEAKEHGKALDNEYYPFARWIIQMNSLAALPPPTKPEQGKEYQNKILGRVMDSYKKRIISEDKLYEDRLGESRANEAKARDEAKNARDKETIEGLCKQIQEFKPQEPGAESKSVCDLPEKKCAGATCEYCAGSPDEPLMDVKTPFMGGLNGLRCSIGQPQTTRPPGVVMPARMSKEGVITM